MDFVRAKRISAELHGKLVGGWEIGDFVGNGASAVVLRAERDGQLAALKLIDPEIIDRFGLDRQLARVDRERELIVHTEPHLVKIFDGGYCAETGYLFVAMEYLESPQLTSVISEFPRERIGAIIEQTASAAKFLESRGIAHRDIKPDNIVITPDYQRAILLDLGVLRPIAVDGHDAGTGDQFLGTTRYSPPEYVMREEEDSERGWRAVTFYQLGAVLHDMIMHRPLFEEVISPPARLVEAVRNSRPVIDAEQVPAHLLALARNCLQKDWRLRLELVQWQDFSEAPAPTQVAEVKERIRRRIALAGSQPYTASPRAAPAPPSRRLLEHLGGLVASMVREICLQSGAFPAIDVRHTAAAGETEIRLRAGPSAIHALPMALEVRIAAAPLDPPEGLILRLRGVASIGEVREEIAPDAWQSVYSGDVSAPAMREKMDDFLHIALDAAQNAGGSVTGGLLRLPAVE